MSQKHPKIIIIGGGISGICAAVKLQTELNIHDYILFEENEDFGGTWLTHTYPGCACDVPSHLYCFSFALNPEWSKTYASQPEILSYLQNLALNYDLYPKAKFNSRVVTMNWMANDKIWKLEVLDEKNGKLNVVYCNIVISGTGGLRLPNIPSEFQSFKKQMIHSVKWDKEIDLKDKIVGVVGTGCSAVQVIPNIRSEVKELILFQRTPPWVAPMHNFRTPEIVRWIFRSFPLILWFYRLLLFWFQEAQFIFLKYDFPRKSVTNLVAKRYIAKEAQELVEKVTPKYPLGCKRVTPSNSYLKTLKSCQIVTDKIAKVTANSICTQDNEYNLDVLILATGYRVHDYFSPLVIKGVGGVDVLELWKQNPSHYLGIMGNAVPNVFFLLGANTASGHNSVIFGIECQVNFTISLIKEMIKKGTKVIRVKKSAEEKFIARIQKELATSVWSQCDSWYSNENKIITTIYPNSYVNYWWETKMGLFNAVDFE